LSGIAVASAQGTAFTYQGQLNENGAAADGSYDLKFSVFDAAALGTLVAGPITNSATTVSSGTFTVTLDFGAGVFPGADRWLEIGARTNGAAAFTTLSQRQQITAVPYAITAGNLTGTVGAGNIANGTITGTMLATGAVGSSQLAAGSVTADALADGTITAAKMATVSTTNWSLLTIVNPTPASVDFFGNAVAGFGNDLLLIGAPSDDALATDSGAAYLYSIDGTRLTTFTNPTPATSDQFGNAFAALGNDRVIIGAFVDDAGAPDSGAVHLFATNGTWLRTLTNPTPTLSGWFGVLVAAVGNDRILVGAQGNAGGAGAAYLLSTNGTVLATFANPAPATGDTFGNSVAVLGTDRVIIGAERDSPGVSEAGSAYLFNVSGALLMTFTNPVPAVQDFFGSSVAAVGTDKVLVGARWDDVGSANHGGAYLFSTNGTLLTTFTNPSPPAGVGPDNFGIAVAGVGSDSVLIGAALGDAGAVNCGSAYLFRTNGAVLGIFTNPPTGGGSGIGTAVAAIGANRLILGAPADTTAGVDAGSVYVFSIETYTKGLVADGVRFAPIIAPRIGIGRFPATNVLEVEGNASKTVAGSWLANSDARIKTDVRTLSGALDKLSQVRLVQFHYTDEYRAQHPSIKARDYLNVVAQEFQAVFPESVQPGSDQLPNGEEVLQVDTHPLTIYSAAAIQELNQKLQQELKQREAENAQLKARLEALERLVNRQLNEGAR
jgi:hypothetical protein